MKFAPHFEKYRNRDLSILKADYDSIEISDPPKDLSHTTTMELDEVEAIVREAKLPKSLVKVADEEPVRLFTSVAKKHKLEPLEQEARAVSEDWNTIAFYFKDKFKRRRPSEILKEHDKEFPINRTSSSESPSYPSGHSMQGYGLAEFYKEKYPYLSDEWDNIADVLAHSRLQLGVHFPSDNKASKSIVDQVVSQQKTAADSHVETRRKQRAKYLDPKDLKDFESRVRKTKDLPDGANYITLPHGRKAVVRTDGGKSHLATILGPAMRPPGRDISSMLIKASGFNKERFLKEAMAAGRRFFSPALKRMGKIRNATANKTRRKGKLKGPSQSTVEPTAQSPVNTQPTTTGMPNQPGYMSALKGVNPIVPAVGIGGGAIGLSQLKKKKPYNPNIFGKKYSHYKQANDLSVLTAVPTQNLDLIMRKGLYSQKAMLEDPEVMAAFLAQRNADKAWKNDEQYDEKRFREQYNKRRELATKPEALEGPSVFWTEPDPDKVSDPRHFVNKFDTQKLRVNLAKLLQDIPETRIHGAELEPFNEGAYEEDPDNYWMRRHRDLTSEEAAKYIATDPKELWKNYKDEYLGRYYAADVPHAHIVTPSGIIPPEYLEQVEKTSSIDLLTGRMGAGKSTLLNKIRDQYDVVEGTDLGSVVDGKFVEPTSEDKPRLRQEKADRLLAAHQAGKRVLMEGYPPGLFRIPGMVEAADRAVILEPDLIQRLTQIGNRSKERGTSVEEDIRYAVSPEHSSKEQKYLDMLSEAIGGTHVSPTSQDAEAYLLKKKASDLSDLEAQFQPDLTPDALKALGVYDQVYGDAPSEASMKEWPEHWINKQDPLGWLQWYDRYSGGRRTDDDERQMKRWKSFKARHLAQYLKKPTPRRAAALRNWGVDAEKY